MYVPIPNDVAGPSAWRDCTERAKIRWCPWHSATPTSATSGNSTDSRAGGDEQLALVREAVAGGCCLVAEDGRILGFATTAPRHLFGRDFVELLIVDEGHRRRGVGRTLLRAVVDRAGTPRVFSSTNESNTAMRSLFAADGWTLSGRLDGLDDGDPEIVYFIDR